MPKYRVGTRVKKIRCRDPQDWTDNMEPTRAPLGAVGTVTGFEDGEIALLWDNYRSTHPTGQILVLAYMIAPLTDPGCERFLESIRQLKPLEEIA